MKTLIFCLLFCSAAANAQQLVLLDRKFKEPFQLRDTFTLDDVANGAFPLYKEDVSEVIGQLQHFAKQLASTKAIGEVPTAFEGQHAQLFLSRNKQWYQCILQSSNKQFSIPLIVGKGSRKGTLKEVNRFMEYLRQNKTAVMDSNLSLR